MLDRILDSLCYHDCHVGGGLNFTPSENRLSPLARLPLMSDMYSRYFLDELRLFGEWSFYGGKHAGNIELSILHPCLRRMTGADHINTRPISGINCMTVALAATTQPGDTVFAIPIDFGGHASTSVLAASMGRTFLGMPMISPHQIDVESLAPLLREHRPSLVYIDQSTMLFPLKISGVRAAIDEESPSTLLHYDSSHLNGLILGGANPNPLKEGADLFGGSTHKTLPGPHKGFLATNNEAVASKIMEMASHFVSHHHSAEMASLAITLLEFERCGGDRYAKQVVANAQTFGRTLHAAGVEVSAEELGFTGCHQVWVTPPEWADANALAREFEACDLILNVFAELPGVSRPSFRISLAEVTRMGATLEHAEILAGAFSDLILGRRDKAAVAASLEPLRDELSEPRYCLNRDALRNMKLDEKVESYCARIWNSLPA